MLKTTRAMMAAILVTLAVVPAMARASGSRDDAGAAIGGPPAAPTADLRRDAVLPDTAKDYSWNNAPSTQRATASPPDERTGPLHLMAKLAPALLMIILVVLGLTLTFSSLRRDIKLRRRVPYRPRGPQRPEL